MHRLFFVVLLTAICAGCSAGTGSGSATPQPNQAGPASTTPRASEAAVPTATPEPSVAALPDPCDLLTYEVVYAAIGGAIGTDPTGNPLTCMWGRHPQPGALPPNDTRPLILLRVLDPSAVEQTASGGSGVTITPVAGLGDEAFFSKVGTASPDLFVRQGTVGFRVTVTDVDKPDEEYYKTTEEAVAREILKSL